MAKWSIDRHEKKLAELICDNDWEGVQKLADEAAKHDKNIAQKTGEIFWDHRHLAG